MRSSRPALLTLSLLALLFPLNAGLADSFDIGVEVSSFKYREPGIMKENGVLAGLAAAYSRRGLFSAIPEESNEWLLRLEGRAAWGKVDYDGALSSGTPYTISGINDFILELRALEGYTVGKDSRLEVTPYAGFGYRYLNDDSSFDPAGYERESNYFYIPLGIDLLSALGGGWKAGLSVEYDFFVTGRQVSHLEDVNPGYNTLNNRQESGYGARGSVRFIKDGGEFSLVIEPFIRYWSIEASATDEWTFYGNPIGYGYEPDNNSTEIGLRVSAVF